MDLSIWEKEGERREGERREGERREGERRKERVNGMSNGATNRI